MELVAPIFAALTLTLVVVVAAVGHRVPTSVRLWLAWLMGVSAGFGIAVLLAGGTFERLMS